MKQIFNWIPNEKILHLASHRSAILFWHSDCYLATGPKFCAILLTNYWAHITSPQNYNVMMYTLEVVGNFMRSIENDRSPYIILCSFNFGHCKLYFSLLTLCMSNALKWQYLVVVGAKPFPANQNVKYESFHWASKYSKLLAGSVYMRHNAINIRWVYHPNSLPIYHTMKKGHENNDAVKNSLYVRMHVCLCVIDTQSVNSSIVIQ